MASTALALVKCGSELGALAENDGVRMGSKGVGDVRTIYSYQSRHLP